MPKQDADTEQVKQLADAVTAALAGDNTQLTAIIRATSTTTLRQCVRASALLGSAQAEIVARNGRRP